MLQNRVTPFGAIIRTPERGSFTGNRGVLHNHEKEIVRAFRLKAWITCRLEFKNRKRIVMSPDRWTELFFLDEATALAAGHRPCAECRRSEFKAFKTAWLQGNPEYGFSEKTSIRELDEIMHRERFGKDGTKATHPGKISRLPDGVFVILDGEPVLVWNSWLYVWSAAGYYNRVSRLPDRSVEVLTPKSVVKALAEGYRPGVAGLGS